MRRAVVAILAALTAALLGALPAAAGVPHAVAGSGTSHPDTRGTVHDAVQTFNSGDPVYVSPKAHASITSGDAGRIRKAIASHPNTAIFVAVLPKLPAKRGGAALQAIKDATDKSGVYVLVSGAVWGYVVHGGALPDTAAQPLNAYVHHHRPTPGHVLAFVHKVQHARKGTSSTARRHHGVPAAGIAGTVVLGLLLVGFVGFVLIRSRQQRKHGGPTSRATAAHRE